MTEEKQKQINKIALDILNEILLEERMLNNYKGCEPGSPDLSLNIVDFNSRQKEFHSRGAAHKKAKLEHVLRVKGYNC